MGQITTSLKEAKSIMNGCFLKTRDIINYENTYYGENISSGSYDDIRRKDLRLLVEARLVINSSEIDLSATNNPNRGYALDAQFAKLLQSYNTRAWDARLSYFLELRKEFREKMEHKRALERLPVTLPSGVCIELSAGEHNLLQKKIIEQFLPLYGMGAQVLYIGDADDKYLFRDDDMLKSLHCFPLGHEELPDIVAYSKEKNLLFLIEAVHSSGPMDEVRVSRLKRLLSDCTADVVFFTAFLDRAAFKKYGWADCMGDRGLDSRIARTHGSFQWDEISRSISLIYLFRYFISLGSMRPYCMALAIRAPDLLTISSLRDSSFWRS